MIIGNSKDGPQGRPPSSRQSNSFHFQAFKRKWAKNRLALQPLGLASPSIWIILDPTLLTPASQLAVSMATGSHTHLLYQSVYLYSKRLVCAIEAHSVKTWTVTLTHTQMCNVNKPSGFPILHRVFHHSNFS